MDSSLKRRYNDTDSNILIKEEPSQQMCNDTHLNRRGHSRPPNIIDNPRKIRVSSHYFTASNKVEIETKDSNKVKIETKDNGCYKAWAMNTSTALNPSGELNSIESELKLPLLDTPKNECSPVYEVVGVHRPPHSVKSVRMNFPNLVIPDEMIFPYEKALKDLQILLRDKGFEVIDRTTLSFFALGKELDVWAAAQCFIYIYQLLITAEFNRPNRALMEQMAEDDFVEGFARHHDGTFGALFKLRNWNIAKHFTAYLFREVLCYIFNMVDYTLLRGGLTHIINARDFTWRSFAPFEQARAIMLWRKCCPMALRRNFLVDLGTYGSIAHSVLNPLASMSKFIVLSTDDVRDIYPDVVLSKSLTGMDSERIKYLTCDEQIAFRFFLD